MDNWLANIVGDVDSLHVKIDNLNDLIVGFCFIRSIDYRCPILLQLRYMSQSTIRRPRIIHAAFTPQPVDFVPASNEIY
jgi:hypothetical protein